MEDSLQRKLAAILYADVAGYSRLTGKDEEGTHRILSEYLDAFTTAIGNHGGRVIHFAGDAILAEFPGVTQALICAALVQKDLGSRNAEWPEERRLRFRIGINLGEVIVDRDDIYGDGVNVAARLETLAEPGGICISGTVHDALGERLPLRYHFMGEQEVKNISKPVRAYRAELEPGATLSEPDPPGNRARSFLSPRPVAVVAAFFVVLAVTLVWLKPWSPGIEPGPGEAERPPLPDKPSIAVLPFDNLGDDPDQEYFADGMTDDLITDLSKVSGLFVIARNSSFKYKGKSVDIKRVGRELGVKYVLEGSVRRADEQIRINAQLIDARTGGHLWAERYDQAMGNLFKLQDRITGNIVSALAVELTTDEQRLQSEETDDVRAYDAYLRGWALYNRQTPESFAKAIPYFEKAVHLDPDYGRAYAALALTYIVGSERGLSLDDVTWRVLRARGRKYLNLAMLHQPTGIAHLAASFLSLKQRLWDDAVAHAEQAVALEPSNANAHSRLAYVLNYAGEPERAIDAAEQAMRLDPANPSLPLQWIGRAQFALGHLEESLEWLDRAGKHNPTVYPAALVYASASAQLGRRKQAEAALAQYLEVWSTQPSIEQIMYYWPFRDPIVAERFVRGILEAGLSDSSGHYYQVSDQDRLNTGTIESLLAGQTITGSNPFNGKQWKRDYSENGTVTWHGSGANSHTGTFTIERDLLCETWVARHEGIEVCFPVFRDPEGPRDETGEYLFITDTGIYAWSRTD